MRHNEEECEEESASFGPTIVAGLLTDRESFRVIRETMGLGITVMLGGCSQSPSKESMVVYSRLEFRAHPPPCNSVSSLIYIDA